MLRFKKVIAGLICLSMILLSQIPTVSSSPSGDNRIIYSKSISEGTHGTYVPATPKPYKIRVSYTVIGEDTSNYWGKTSPYCHIRNNSQWIVYDNNVFGRPLSGSFDVLPGQQAYVEIMAGSAWGLTNSWQIPISETLTYYYDNDAPPAPVLSANATFLNDALYTNGPINLSWTAVADNPISFEDNGYYGPSGIRGYKIFDNSSEIPGGYITETSKQLTLNEGIHLLTVKVYDNETHCKSTGNESDASNLVKIIVDQTPPTGNISINNDQNTNNPNVTLSLSNINDGSNGSGVTQVGFSNDNETFDWYPCTESIITENWTLSPGDGQKTVYMKLKDALGNETPNENAIPATITLDTTPPGGSFTINAGAGLTTSQLVMLTLEASDELSGVAKMQFSNDGTNFSTAEEFKPTKYWTLSDGEGTKTVYVKFTDTVGNTTTQAITDSIHFDPNPVYSGLIPTRTLQDNEEWSGDYPIFGQVIVPAGKTLTIRQNAKVTVDGPTDVDPYQNGLIVKGTLNIETGVTFTTVQIGWMGIIVSGTAEVTGAYINLAERGLAILENAAVTVDGCTFAQNFAGIHAYASHPAIKNCTFRNNIYGIKEDEGGQPTVTSCVFTSNEIPYYHETLTKITIDQLNQILGNNGNQ